MKYKNIGGVARTFYGVTIAPGEVADVPGYVNNKFIVSVSDDHPVNSVKAPEDKPTKKQPSSDSKVKSDENKKENKNNKEDK